MNKNKMSIIFKGIIIVACILGVATKTKLDMDFFTYYTNLSNVLCFVGTVLAFIYGIKNGRKNHFKTKYTFAPRFRGAIMLAITVTFGIYWTLLHKPGAPVDVPGFLQHFLVPVLIIADWAIFDEKGKFKKTDPILWLLIPVIYVVGVYIAAAIRTTPVSGDSYFPYFFLDYQKQGIGVTALYIAALLLIFLVIGYIYYGISYFASKKNLKKVQ